MPGPALLARFADRYAPWLSLILALGGALWVVQPGLFPTPQQRLAERTAWQLSLRDRDCLVAAAELLQVAPESAFARALLAESAALHSQHQLALDHYAALPQDQSQWEFISHQGQGQRWQVLGRLTQAEQSFRRAHALNPYHTVINERLGHVLQLQGRVWEAAPYFFRQILRGKCRGDELAGMASVERFFRSDERLSQLVQTLYPPELSLELARARTEIFDNKLDPAAERLQQLLAVHPELGEAQGRLGRILVDRGQLTQFLLWRGSLPEAARNHPEVLYVEGLQARRSGQLRGAVHCFLRTLQLSPNHLGATTQIAGALEATGYSQESQWFRRRAILLTELESTLNLSRQDPELHLLQRLTEILGGLGRYWEAAGWCQVMCHLEVPQDEPRRGLRHWLTLARGQLEPTAREHHPAHYLKLSDFPPPVWNLPASPAVTSPPQSSQAESTTQWDLVNHAERLGLKFEYFEGTTEENRLEHIFNVMGAGVGAIDFDGDYWPDLYWAQGNDWHDSGPQPQWSDRLFRNLGGERFVDVTDQCRIHEANFSHGVTVGDYDQDGFPDLYIGNLGSNRLFRNQGDGTFEDVTAASGAGGNEWSTSSVFADFNQDGLPDLYVLNYTLKDETAAKICTRNKGEKIACTPDVLPAEHDRLYLNQGDGRFLDVSEAAGIRGLAGKGLGIVVADYMESGRLSVFIGNDTMPNFLMVNTGNSPDGAPQFREEGVVRGVAFDVDGNAQASMGIAAGDLTGDGLLDLFVTNFFAESNTLYGMQSNQFFEELTRPWNLKDGSFWMNGFGTQLVDVNQDGWEDLLISNGHVDQTTSRGDPDRMPPQVYLNQQGQRFEAVPPAKLGAFFQSGYLGRGVARLDWNRDGGWDVAISHIHGPAALLTHHSDSPPKVLRIRLIGRTGTREPVGAQVRIRHPEVPWVRFQTAGDGFLSSNERVHHFPLPNSNDLLTVEVKWPNGTLQRWSIASTSGEVILLEGQSATYPLGR